MLENFAILRAVNLLDLPTCCAPGLNDRYAWEGLMNRWCGSSCNTLEKLEMPVGKVKWFNTTKGYGFIQPDEGGKDLFVHHTEVVGSGFKSLTEGAKVSFESRDGQKGPEATQVDTIG